MGVPKYEYDLLLLLGATCCRYSQGFYVLYCQQQRRPIIIIQNGDFLCKSMLGNLFIVLNHRTPTHMVFTRQCALRHIERDIEILKVLERMTLTLSQL